MILYWMLNGRLPYDNIDDIDILRNTICGMKSVSIPRESLKRLPKSFQDALRAMLQIDPEFRPTTSQLLAMIQSGKPIERSVSKSKFAIQKSPTLPQLPPVPELRKLDENSRITLALFIVSRIKSSFYLTLSDYDISVSNLSFTSTSESLNFGICFRNRRTQDSKIAFSSNFVISLPDLYRIILVPWIIKSFEWVFVYLNDFPPIDGRLENDLERRSVE